MSKIVIKNENQLINFLNVLAEESIQKAYSSMDGKAQQQKVAHDISVSKREFIEEEDPPGDEPSSPPAEKAPPPAPSEEEPSSISPKFDSLVDAINDLRGAPSSRDSNVEAQLRAYYDKLDTPEAASAILMIRMISQVMKGEVEGAKASDPSDFQITMSMKGESEAPAASPKVAAPAQPVAQAEKPEDEESEPAGPEDSTPPIKVGGAQVTEAYRNKIRSLLERV